MITPSSLSYYLSLASPLNLSTICCFSIPSGDFFQGRSLPLPLPLPAVTNTTSRALSSDEKESYTARQAKTGRPLSPHVTIYAFPAAALTSIANRVTGVALVVGEARPSTQWFILTQWFISTQWLGLTFSPSITTGDSTRGSRGSSY